MCFSLARSRLGFTAEEVFIRSVFTNKKKVKVMKIAMLQMAASPSVLGDWAGGQGSQDLTNTAAMNAAKGPAQPLVGSRH